MIFFLNCSNLHLAGGLNVALNVIKEFSSEKYKHDFFYIIAPKNVGYEQFKEIENFKFYFIKYYTFEIVNLIFRFFLDLILINFILNKSKPQVIFSLGNLPTPNFRKIPQGVLFMYPYIAYFDNTQIFERLSFKENLKKYFLKQSFTSRKKYANIFFPQTEAIGQRLKKYYGISNFKTFPCAYTQISKNNDIGLFNIQNKENIKLLLALTKYYTHKNLEVLIEVASIAKSANAPFKILLTIEANQHKNAEIIINKIKDLHLEDYLINLGNINIMEVPKLYQQVDACILPTLIESYSATFIDAFYFRKPLFVSDLDFAKEQCKEHAFYFDPLDPNSIFLCIINNILNDDLINVKVENAFNYCQSLPNWENIVGGYYSELKKIIQSETTHPKP